METAITQIIPAAAASVASTLPSLANTTIKCDFHDLIKIHRSEEFLCNQAAKHLCLNNFDQFNFYDFYWCQIDGNLPILLLVYAMAIFIIFRYTNITVDEFVAEGITKISESLGFSESLAAATLLAFANGAGDVITAIVASGQEGGVSYNIGALYGAGLFVCSITIVICIFISKEPIVYDSMIIYRDIGIYILSTIVTALLAWYGYLTWWSSCLLLGLYVLLVLIVIITEQIEKRRQKEKESKGQMATLLNQAEKDSLIKTVASILVQGGPEANKNSVLGLDKQLKKTIGSIKEDALVKKINDSYAAASDEEYKPSAGDSSIEAAKAVGLAVLLAGGLHMREEAKGDLNLKVLDLANASIRTFLKIKLAVIKERQAKKNKKHFSDYFYMVVDFPGKVLFYLTCLPAAEEEYSRLRCLVYCIPGFAFMWWVVHPEIDRTYLYFPLPAGAILFLIFALTLPKDKPPKWSALLDVLSVIAGLMWTKVLVEVLLDMLSSLNVFLNLGKTYLGLTILAVGNSLPDTFTTISLCKSGVGTMAISGGYAGQLFGYLIGFGLAMLKQTILHGPQKFDLFDFSNLQKNIY